MSISNHIDSEVVSVKELLQDDTISLNILGSNSGLTKVFAGNLWSQVRSHQNGNIDVQTRLYDLRNQMNATAFADCNTLNKHKYEKDIKNNLD